MITQVGVDLQRNDARTAAHQAVKKSFKKRVAIVTEKTPTIPTCKAGSVSTHDYSMTSFTCVPRSDGDSTLSCA